MGWTTDPILCTGTFVRFVKRVEMRQLFGDRPGPLTSRARAIPQSTTVDGASLGAGIKLGAVRIEWATEQIAGTGNLFVSFGECIWARRLVSTAR